MFPGSLFAEGTLTDTECRRAKGSGSEPRASTAFRCASIEFLLASTGFPLLSTEFPLASTEFVSGADDESDGKAV